MAPRTRKETTSRKKSWEFVVSSIDTHGGEVAVRLAEVLREDLRDGEEMPDIPLFFQLLGRRLTRFGAAMVEASEGRLDELADDEGLRDQRNEATSALTADYIAFRGGFTTAYGATVAAEAGFEKNVASDPATMELQVDRLVTNLEKPDLVLPPTRYAGIEPRAAETVMVFRPNLNRLKAARAALNRASSEADSSQLAKNDAVQGYDREFTDLSRCFEGCAVVAKMPELAQRVRPSLRRPGRRQAAEGEEESSAGGETPSEEASPEGTPAGDAPSGGAAGEGPPPSAAATDGDSGARQGSAGS
jgi:hypothetical protein